ncbi:MAG: hypothetical protein DRM98_05565 [Thermoplasmata archaeon]|nr:MAG: hypothetical protein DRM98_05565 [Thermoplasmata archaeon]
MFIENILGSTSKIKILRLFFEYPNRTFLTREIFEDTKVGVGYGLKCMKLLLLSDLIKMKKVGNQKRYSLNEEHKFYPILNEIFSNERKNYPNISFFHRGIIAEKIEKLHNETVILFGSIAAGTATPQSDIDILIITKRKREVREKIKIIEKKSSVSIQGIILSREKLRENIKKKTRIIKNIAKEKIFLTGDKRILEEIENV